MYVLSFDCGHESLGVALAEMHMDILKSLHHLIVVNRIDVLLTALGDKRVNEDDKTKIVSKLALIFAAINTTAPKIMTPIMVHSACLMSDIKKSNVLTRAQNAKGYLTSLTEFLKSRQIAPDIVLVEDQTINHLSGEIEAQIIIYFIEPLQKATLLPPADWNFTPSRARPAYPKVISVNPRFKNKICFGPGLELSTFYGKYVDKYTAHKEHCRANFAKITHAWYADNSVMADVCNKKLIPAKKQRDASEAMIQIFGAIAFLQ